MAKIDLLELYPEFKSGMHEKETCCIELPDDIAEEEKVSEFVIRSGIERGIKCLNLRLKY